MTNPWRPIADAPRDRPIDICAKIWLPDEDTFKFRRFTDCTWDAGDAMTNRKPHWRGIDAGWRPVAWMDPPALPINEGHSK